MRTSKENKTKVKKQKYFIDDWVQDKGFSNWLVKDKNDNTKARFSACHKSIELFSSGRSVLTDHAKGMKHISVVNKVPTFFNPKSVKSLNQFQLRTIVLIVLLLWTLPYYQIREHWIHSLRILILQKQK